MQIETEIKFDGAGSSKTPISIDKFFQFIIFRDYKKDKAKVSIYTALAFQSQKKSITSDLHVSIKLDGKVPNGIKYYDKSDFYSKIDVISRFWGSNCRLESSIFDSCKHYVANNESTEGVDTDKIAERLKNEGKFTGTCIYINEEKEIITNFLLLPYKIRKLSNQQGISLDGKLTDYVDTIQLSNGYWFRTDFEIQVEKLDKNEFYFSSSINLIKTKFTSPDFKVYFLTPENYELKSNSISILPEGENTNNSKEIIKILSKKDIVYFQEWVDLGIYQSSLYKLQLNSTIQNDFKKSGVKKIEFSVQMEDSNFKLKQGINLLIFSIFLSLFFSYGLDYTRQSDDLFINKLPSMIFGTNLISPSFVWIIIGVALIFKYIYIHRIKMLFKLKVLCFSFFSAWIFLYTIPNDFSVWMKNDYFSKTIQWIIIIDLLLSTCLMLDIMRRGIDFKGAYLKCMGWLSKIFKRNDEANS